MRNCILDGWFLIRFRPGRLARAAALLLLALLLPLSGCNTNAIYQDNLYNPPVYWGTHVVKKGENLYRIAWRYGRDYRELGNAPGTCRWARCCDWTRKAGFPKAPERYLPRAAPLPPRAPRR